MEEKLEETEVVAQKTWKIIIAWAGGITVLLGLFAVSWVVLRGLWIITGTLWSIERRRQLPRPRELKGNIGRRSTSTERS